MAKSSLPPGFRFHPTDVELVSYYLKRKIMGKKISIEAISEVELYKFAPWDLPDKSHLQSKDLEWYFFCPRDKKYPNGSRTNRATDNGYWKTSGKDRTIVNKSCIVGMKKTLIFHEGKAPKGDRTDWVMYEYRLEDNEVLAAGFSKDSYVLCKIFKKSGLGPRIGEQYGAPFSEEDWDDDADTENAFLAFMSGHSPELVNSTVVEPTCQQSVPSGGGEVVSTTNIPTIDDVLDPPEVDGLLLEQLAQFLSDSPLHFDSTSGELPDFANMPEAEARAPHINAYEMYKQLEDLIVEPGGRSTESLYPSITNSEQASHPVLSELGNGNYLELNDLFSLGATMTSELSMPNDILSQNPFEHFQYPHVDNTCFGDDDALATSFMAGNLLPTIFYPHDQSAATSECTMTQMQSSAKPLSDAAVPYW